MAWRKRLRADPGAFSREASSDERYDLELLRALAPDFPEIVFAANEYALYDEQLLAEAVPRLPREQPL